MRHSYSNILNSKVGVKKLRRDGSFMSLISWLSNTNIFGFYCCCGVDLAFNPKHWYVLTCEKHQKHSLCRFVWFLDEYFERWISNLWLWNEITVTVAWLFPHRRDNHIVAGNINPLTGAVYPSVSQCFRVVIRVYFLLASASLATFLHVASSGLFTPLSKSWLGSQIGRGKKNRAGLNLL